MDGSNRDVHNSWHVKHLRNVNTNNMFYTSFQIAVSFNVVQKNLVNFACEQIMYSFFFSSNTRYSPLHQTWDSVWIGGSGKQVVTAVSRAVNNNEGIHSNNGTTDIVNFRIVDACNVESTIGPLFCASWRGNSQGCRFCPWFRGAGQRKSSWMSNGFKAPDQLHAQWYLNDVTFLLLSVYPRYDSQVHIMEEGGVWSVFQQSFQRGLVHDF